jgi:hypothetical protein
MGVPPGTDLSGGPIVPQSLAQRREADRRAAESSPMKTKVAINWARVKWRRVMGFIRDRWKARDP